MPKLVPTNQKVLMKFQKCLKDSNADQEPYEKSYDIKILRFPVPIRSVNCAESFQHTYSKFKL